MRDPERLDLHVHFHLDPVFGRALDLVTGALTKLERKLDDMRTQMALDFTTLTAKVEATETAEASAAAALTAIAQEVRDLKTQITDPNAQAQIDALANRLDAAVAPLSAAIASSEDVEPAPATGDSSSSSSSSSSTSDPGSTDTGSTS